MANTQAHNPNRKVYTEKQLPLSVDSHLEASLPRPPQPTTLADEPNLPSSPNTTPLVGWRLVVVLIAAFLGLFLSLLDSTIVAVALTTIADEFGAFDQSSWVITAYLLTYMAFSIIVSRLSDIFGRKIMLLVALTLFAAFSLGCALSRSMLELIVLRAFQGMGASGLFTLAIVIALESFPPQDRGYIGAAVSIVQVVSGVMGPLVGGALSTHGTNWRWIFYLNLPICAVAILIVLLAWPSDQTHNAFSTRAFRSIDILGCLLLLSASVLFVFALQQAGSFTYAWDSGAIITCLVLAATTLLAFIGWQLWLASRPDLIIKPVFPMHVIRHRVMGSALIVNLLNGFVFYIAIVNIPERSEIVDGVSPITAGVRLLPMLLTSALGAFVGGAINSKRNVTAYTLTTASAFQVIGYGLMTTLGGGGHFSKGRLYGFQVFLGLGFGLSIASATQMTALQAEPAYIAITQGALAQFRSLGGSVGLAIGVIVFNSAIRSSSILAELLSPAQRSALFKSPLVILTFTLEQQYRVSEVFAEAFTRQMRIALYISAAGFLLSLLTWQRTPPQPLDLLLEQDSVP